MALTEPQTPDSGLNLAEKFITLTGKSVAWLTLLMVLLTFTVVVLRYGFNLGWIWLQESVTYLHAIVFMVAAAWTLLIDDHVRVDIFYRGRSEQHQAWINLVGTLIFLVPVCIFLLVASWDYVEVAWRVQERSREADGIPFVYLLKTLLLILPVLLLIQAGNLAVRCLRTLRSTD